MCHGTIIETKVGTHFFSNGAHFRSNDVVHSAYPQLGLAIFRGPAASARTQRPKIASVNPYRNNVEKKMAKNAATRNVHSLMCNKNMKKGKTARESKIKNFGNLAESRQLAFAEGARCISVTPFNKSDTIIIA